MTSRYNLTKISWVKSVSLLDCYKVIGEGWWGGTYDLKVATVKGSHLANDGFTMAAYMEL